MYFRNYRVSKTCLDHSLKGAVSEHPSTVNILKGPKDFRKLHESTFIIFFYHSRGGMVSEISPLLNFEIRGVFLDTLTAD